MSYNKKKDDLRKSPLIEDNSQDQFRDMQNKFLEFIKIYEEITEYENKLSGLNRNEYDRIKDAV
jgi:hypothetical protein